MGNVGVASPSGAAFMPVNSEVSMLSSGSIFSASLLPAAQASPEALLASWGRAVKQIELYLLRCLWHLR